MEIYATKVERAVAPVIVVVTSHETNLAREVSVFPQSQALPRPPAGGAIGDPGGPIGYQYNNAWLKNQRQPKKLSKLPARIFWKTVKDLIAQGNVRHITIKDKDGKTILKFPLTIGVVFLPVLAAVGAVAA